MTVTIDDIRAAAKVIEGQVLRTPTVKSAPISALTGAEVYLKLETMQRTGSFKERGALVKLSSLDDDARKNGVIAVSAGNHAQGLAHFATQLGIPATIVMPKGTPFSKVRRTEGFGAKVILEGETVHESMPFADKLATEEGLTFIHPFDDEKIVAGQGTVGLEMLEAVPELDTIVVPIGGGGLIAGIATAAKAINKRIEIVGVQAELYPSMYQAIHSLESTSGGSTLAEGIAVKTPGAITRPIVEKLVDEIMLASELALESAVETMLDEAKLVVEGAGAAPLAALIENQDRFVGRKVGLVVSGSSIDPRLLAAVLMRGMMREGRLLRLRIELSDQPGALAKVSKHIGETGANIVEIYHQRMFYDVPVKMAELDAVVETRDPAHGREVVTRLKAAGFPTRLLGLTSYSD
ncbi:MAG: threonine ammonia-lyase [Alphaproteobacteria bacterium]